MERLDARAVEEEADQCGVVLTPEEVDARRSDLRRGWYWGTQAFAERMLKVAEAPLKRLKSRSYRGEPVQRMHNEKRAAELLREGLEVAELSAQDLEALPGADPRKVAIARVIWEQTTVSQEWLAERLAMGSAVNVSQQIRRQRQKPSANFSFRLYPSSHFLRAAERRSAGCVAGFQRLNCWLTTFPARGNRCAGSDKIRGAAD